MRITSVTYRRLISFGDYENLAVEATAEVQGYETPEVALGNLRAWVETQAQTQVGAERIAVDLERDLRWKEQQIRDIERRMEDAGERWKRACEFLKSHGVELPPELPF